MVVWLVGCLERFTSGGKDTDSETLPVFQVLDKEGLKKSSGRGDEDLDLGHHLCPDVTINTIDFKETCR